MGDRPEERIGRCCAKCKSPWGCGRALCGCHGNPDASCRFCGIRLYVPRPRPRSIREMLAHKVGEAA